MNDKIWEQLNLKQMNELIEEMTNLTHYSFEDVARELAGGNMGEVLRMIGATVADSVRARDF